METQEAERRLPIGRGLGEDGGEERVEELDGLAAGGEDDEFVVLGELGCTDGSGRVMRRS